MPRTVSLPNASVDLDPHQKRTTANARTNMMMMVTTNTDMAMRYCTRSFGALATSGSPDEKDGRRVFTAIVGSRISTGLLIRCGSATGVG